MVALPSTPKNPKCYFLRLTFTFLDNQRKKREGESSVILLTIDKSEIHVEKLFLDIARLLSSNLN